MEFWNVTEDVLKRLGSEMALSFLRFPSYVV